MDQPERWRHMTSAPRDGSRILVTVRSSEQGAAEVDVAYWSHGDRFGTEGWRASDSSPGCIIEYAEPELYYAAHRDEIQGKGYSLVPSRYIEFIDRDTEIDYQSALSEMSDKFNALKKRWDANETELVNAFKILGYGKE